MTSNRFDAQAFEAKVFSLHRAFEHACARSTLHLCSAAACMPDDALRVTFLASAREEVRAARAAITESATLFATIHGTTSPPLAHAAIEASIVADIEMQVDALSSHPGA